MLSRLASVPCFVTDCLSWLGCEVPSSWATRPREGAQKRVARRPAHWLGMPDSRGEEHQPRMTPGPLTRYVSIERAGIRTRVLPALACSVLRYRRASSAAFRARSPVRHHQRHPLIPRFPSTPPRSPQRVSQPRWPRGQARRSLGFLLRCRSRRRTSFLCLCQHWGRERSVYTRRWPSRRARTSFARSVGVGDLGACLYAPTPLRRGSVVLDGLAV